ncbi:hypothetical protein OF83DRAFT_1089534, partial [Amylostereum chailletii]
MASGNPFNSERALDLMDAAAALMRDCYNLELAAHLGSPPPPVLPPSPLLSPCSVPEIRRMAVVMSLAILNPIWIPWVMEHHNDLLHGGQDGGVLVKEADMKLQFPPLDPPLAVCDPAVIIDPIDRLLTWYLPQILSPELQEEVIDWVRIMDTALQAPLIHTTFIRSDKWRSDSVWYNKPSLDDRVSAGQVELSLGWFSQAHEKAHEHLHVSKHLHMPCCQKFIGTMSENGAIISAVLAIAHPDMFEAGQKVLLKLGECPGHEVLAAQFSFITPVISVITNRETPAHRDTQSSHFPWFDCLATFGGDADLTLGLPTFGVVFQYLSGSMALFCGAVYPSCCLKATIPGMDPRSGGVGEDPPTTLDKGKGRALPAEVIAGVRRKRRRSVTVNRTSNLDWQVMVGTLRKPATTADRAGRRHLGTYMGVRVGPGPSWIGTGGVGSPLIGELSMSSLAEQVTEQPLGEIHARPSTFTNIPQFTLPDTEAPAESMYTALETVEEVDKEDDNWDSDGADAEPAYLYSGEDSIPQRDRYRNKIFVLVDRTGIHQIGVRP